MSELPQLPNITLSFEQILEENESRADCITYKIRCVYNGITYEQSRNINKGMKPSKQAAYTELLVNGMINHVITAIRFDFPKFLIENEL
jgi:lipopolysaccharide biosynthesis glycosyltransferase